MKNENDVKPITTKELLDARTDEMQSMLPNLCTIVHKNGKAFCIKSKQLRFGGVAEWLL